MNAPVESGLEEAARQAMGQAAGGHKRFSVDAAQPGIQTSEKSLLGVPLPSEEARVPEVQDEARFRLAEILDGLSKDHRPFVEFELQEIQHGNLPDPEKGILKIEELEKILYAEKLSKPDIRLIIAGIRHRADAALRASRQKAAEKRRTDRRAAYEAAAQKTAEKRAARQAAASKK